MSKEAVVIILDIGYFMGCCLNDNDNTKLDIAKSAFRLMIEQKLLFGGKQDVVSVLLFNSKNTKNSCNDEYGGYESIEEYYSLQTPNLDLLECIDNIQCNKTESGKIGDALDSLLVAAQSIINFCGTKKYIKRIFMITDGLTKINDTEQMEIIANSFIDENILLNIIGIGFSDNDDDNDDNINIKLLKKFIKLVNGSIFSGSTAISMMSCLRSKSVLLRPTYSGLFEITSSIKINIKLFCRCREQILPSLKKESLIGQETKKVSMDRLYKNKFRINEDDEEVEEDERVKSYLYGKERIPFNENDELKLNYKSGDKHFKCLGFINKSLINRNWFMSSSYIVTPDINSKLSQLLLSIFIQSCFEKNVFILCRLVSRKNASPKFVVLQPRSKTNKDIFILNELPFYEDIRKFPFASFKIKKQYQPNKQQIDSCKKLIKSLSLYQNDKEELIPKQTFNPILQRFYQNLQIRALDSQSKLQELDPIILKYLQPDPQIFNNENTKKCIQNFKQTFPTKIIPKKQIKKERKHWNDINDELDNLFIDIDGDDDDDDDNNNNNHNKKEEEKDDEIELENLIITKQITSIGTTTPLSDFDYLLSKKNSTDLFISLSRTMWTKIIHPLIDNSLGDIHYEKAINCINHLRKVSIREEDYKLFNDELNKFKTKYFDKKKNLWKLLINNKITLISNQDIDSCEITKSEAQNFLKENIEQIQEIKSIENDSDDDNEFDDLI